MTGFHAYACLEHMGNNKDEDQMIDFDAHL